MGKRIERTAVGALQARALGQWVMSSQMIWLTIQVQPPKSPAGGQNTVLKGLRLVFRIPRICSVGHDSCKVINFSRPPTVLWLFDVNLEVHQFRICPSRLELTLS